jgi:copper(I)-binding protein
VRLPLGALLVIVGCAGAPGTGVEITGAFGYAPPTTSEGAVYLTLFNHGPGEDTLTRVTTPVAAGVMMHLAVPSGAMVVMEHLEHLALPVGESVRMEPGALHLMLMDLAPLPQAGDSLTLQLEFSRGVAQTIRVPIIPYGDPPDTR